MCMGVSVSGGLLSIWALGWGVKGWSTSQARLFQRWGRLPGWSKSMCGLAVPGLGC